MSYSLLLLVSLDAMIKRGKSQVWEVQRTESANVKEV